MILRSLQPVAPGASCSVLTCVSFRQGLVWRLATVATLAIVAGCSRSLGPDVQYVEGRVVLDGQPLARAMVGFNPDSEGGVSASGQTDDAGVFKLTSARAGAEGRGAVVGSYVVTVWKYRNRVEELGPAPDLATDPDGAQKFQLEVERVTKLPPESLIPTVYADKATSPLKANVKQGRNNGPDMTFELKSDAKPAK